MLKLIAVDLRLAPVRRWSRANRNCSGPEMCFGKVTWTCSRRSVLVAATWWSSLTARVGRFTSISNTVSPVKHFLRHTTASAPKSAPFRSHGKLGAIINQRLACNLAGGTQFDPTISPVATSIMIITSNSLLGGSGRSNQVGGDLLHTMDVVGLSRANRTL